MKKFKNYETAKAYVPQEKLPVGGYICKILNAEIQSTNYGDKLVISFDIAEGEHKDFYAANYKAQDAEDKKWKGNYRVSVPADDGSEDDNKVMGRFKTFIQRIEDSNSGYHWDWDEKKLKGKLIGIIFNEKEYNFEGRTGFFTNPIYTTTIEEIREGKFKIPAPTYLKQNSSSNAGASQGSDGFMNIPDGFGEELPFI
jgi:hypothetical protein